MLAAGLAVQALDTGRVLLIQRAPDKHDDDATYARWELPGGKLDAQDAGVWDGALREFEEETGGTLDDACEHAGSFLTPDGRYQCYIVHIPSEAAVTLAPQASEVADIGWWDPSDLNDSRVRDKVQELLPQLTRFLKVDASIGARTGMVSLDLMPGTIPVLDDGVQDHHITVVFLGSEVTDDLIAEVLERAAAVAAGMDPLSGTVGGLGTFAPSSSSDGQTPVFAIPDVPGLGSLRAAFEDLNGSEHTDYHPHVTLTYLGADDPMPEPVPDTPVTFDCLSVHVGERVWRFPFGQPVAKAAAAEVHRHADRIAEHYAPLIADALDDAFPDAALHAAITAASSNAVKVRRGSFNRVEKMTPAELAAEALAARSGNTSKLATVLAGLYGDGGLQGAHAAAAATQGVIGAGLDTVAPSADYWAGWQPGWGAAAAQAANGGLARLLNQTGTTIRGITGTTIDRLGDAIARGVAAGDSVDTVARGCRDLITDPQRATVIANTEMARAMTAAATDTYQANGVSTVDWLLEDDACDLCQENADAGPLPIGDEWPNGSPPAHPSCRCSLAPNIDSILNS